MLFIEAEDSRYEEPEVGKSIRDFENMGDDTIELHIIEFKDQSILLAIDQMV